jgi:hypothetical protein
MVSTGSSSYRANTETPTRVMVEFRFFRMRRETGEE